MPTEAEPARVRSTVPYSATRELIDQLWKFANIVQRLRECRMGEDTVSQSGIRKHPIIA
jgi:hypothetical protein